MIVIVEYALWTLALLLALAGVAAALWAIRTRKPRIALLSAIPLGLGLLLAAFGLDPFPDARIPLVVLALAIAAIGVLGGNPITIHVLDLATRDSVRRGTHGGILIRRDSTGDEQEVLRGGTTIGYLERIAIVGAIAIGHPEVIAAIIAIKGLGRFSELDTAPARERFIIGTLASMIWATAAAVLIVATAG